MYNCKAAHFLSKQHLRQITLLLACQSFGSEANSVELAVKIHNALMEEDLMETR